MLMKNWLRIIGYISSDMRHLQRSKIFTLEELTSHPQRVYTEILSYLDLHIEQDVVNKAVTMVKANPNDKYKAQFCRDIYSAGIEAGVSRFTALNEKFGSDVRKYGYDLDDYFKSCPQPLEVPLKEEIDNPPAALGHGADL